MMWRPGSDAARSTSFIQTLTSSNRLQITKSKFISTHGINHLTQNVTRKA